ncbi:MAG: hypothetical protein K2K70_02780, partial [Lachnospiraceae bacterium]|nr:hypothetical protein [Lachnospiraceae bacterium]
YQDNIEMTEGLEELVSDKMTDQKKGNRTIFQIPTTKGIRRTRLRPVFAMLCGVLLLGSAITTYGAVRGLSVDQLFAVIWGERQQKNSLEQFDTKVDVLTEKSTFKDIDIEPVQAISDGHSTYVVVKVTGINGFCLTDEMSFDAFSLDDAKESTDSLNSYVLKREGNTIYVALWALWNRTEKIKEGQQECSIGIYNLYHVELDETGGILRTKHTLSEPDPEDGTSYERYTEESIAAKGEYRGKILCDVQSDQLEIPTEEYGTFRVGALSVITTQDISDEFGLNTDVVDILMKDGSKVPAIHSSSQDGFTAFELREPVDPKKVTGIRVLNHTYDIGKK